MVKKNESQHADTVDRLDKVTSLFEIPKETVLDVPIIHMIGKKEISIENFDGIIEYGDKTIRLKTNDGILSIRGETLQAKSMTSEVIKIKGNIESISFDC
ncbi:MAG: sporulation protein YqfC [Cellulosilyticaceae bacterium]